MFMKKLISALEKVNLPIYIAGHICPDDDSIGSCLAIGYLLKKMGKEAYILLEYEDKEILCNHPIDCNIVSQVSHNDFAFIAMDLNERYRLGNFEKYISLAKETFNIDHHQGNSVEANHTLTIETSSTCEIVHDLISIVDKKLLKDINLCQSLYLGILTDSKGFTKRLSNKTLTIAQELINVGLDYSRLISKTIHYRTLYEFKALALIIKGLKKTKDFWYCVIDKKKKQYRDLTQNEIVKTLSEELRKIDSIDIMLVLIKNENNIVGKVVSNVSENAHLIAKSLGGGGHKGEAGFTTTKTIKEILTSVTNYLNNQSENN